MKKFLQIVVITPLIILFTTRSPGAQYRPLHLSSSSRSVNARRRSIIPYVPSPPQELDRNHAARFVLIHVPPAPFYPWQTPQLRQQEHEIIQHVFQPGLIVSSSCFCSTASTWTTVPRLDLGTKSGLDMEIGASFGSESSDDESEDDELSLDDDAPRPLLDDEELPLLLCYIMVHMHAVPAFVMCARQS